MTDFCSIDGRLTPLGEGLPGGVYLYQRLRTVDYRPLHTAAHLSRLRDGAGSLFGRPAELPAGRIADEIGALLHANGYPAGGRDRHAAALCRRDVRLDGRRRVALSHLCPAKPASCGGGRSLRRLPSRMAHVGTPRNGTVGAAGGRAVRCALCASLRPRRHRPQGRRRAAVRRARRRDLRRTPRRRGVDVGGRSGAGGQASGGWNDPSAQRSFGCSTNSSPSTARGSARSPPSKARPICRSRPNASPRHWRRFPNGRERFRAEAGRFAGRAGRPAFPEK